MFRGLVRLNPVLKLLGLEWWENIYELFRAMVQIDQLKVRLLEFTEKVIVCSTDHDAAVSTRNCALMGVGNGSEQAKQANNAGVDETEQALLRCRGGGITLRDM